MRASLLFVMAVGCGGGESPVVDSGFELHGSSCQFVGGPPSMTATLDFELSLAVGETFRVEVVTSDEIIVSGSVEGFLQCGDQRELENRYAGSSGLDFATCVRRLASEPDAVIGSFEWQAFLDSVPASAHVTLATSILDEAQVEVQSSELVVDCVQP